MVVSTAYFSTFWHNTPWVCYVNILEMTLRGWSVRLVFHHSHVDEGATFFPVFPPRYDMWLLLSRDPHSPFRQPCFSLWKPTSALHCWSITVWFRVGSWVLRSYRYRSAVDLYFEALSFYWCKDKGCLSGCVYVQVMLVSQAQFGRYISAGSGFGDSLRWFQLKSQ